MPAYESDLYVPPAPVASVTLRNPASDLEPKNVLLIIDSGADVTLLPRTSVELLWIVIDSTNNYELKGFDDKTTYSPAVFAEAVFEQRTFRGEYLLIDQDVGLLSRDILNHFTLLLDGPNLLWEVH